MKKKATAKKDSSKFMQMKAYCETYGFGLPIAEFEFAKASHKRKWRLDCCWPQYKLAMEFMGGVWIGGRHVGGSGYTKDCEKACHLAILGWYYMPITSDQFRKGLAFKWFEEFMKYGD